MEALKGIVIASAVCVVCLLFGARLLALFRIKPPSVAERALLAAGIGQVAVAYLILALGLLHQLYLSRLVALLAVCLALGAGQWPLLRDCFSRIRARLTISRLRSPWSLAYLLIGIALCLSLVDCLAPPGFTDWDGLSHHLPVPAEFVRHHSVHYVPWTSHSNQPYTIQMFFAIGLLCDSTDAAKLFHFAYTLLTLAALWTLARRFLGAPAGLLAALALITMPLVGWLSGVAYADMGLPFFTVLALHFFLAWARDEDRQALWLSAASAGCGMAVKMQAVMVFAILCGLVAANLLLDVLATHPRRCFRPVASAARLAAFAAIAIAIASPWYVKTTIYTGNPFYPFAYALFDGRNWSRENAEAYRRHQAAFGMPPPGREGGDYPSPRTLKNLVALPWNVTMRPWYFDVLRFRAPQRHFPAIAWGSCGPAFLAFVPVAVLALVMCRPRPVALYWLLAFAFVFFLATYFLMQYTRYMLPGLAALCPLVAWPIALAFRVRSRAAAVAASLLALCAVSALFLHALYTRQQVRVALGIQSDEQYLALACETYPLAQFVNSSIPPDARIGAYGEPRVFYIDRDVMWADPGHHEMIPYRAIANPSQLLHAYEAVGLDYLVLAATFRRQVAQDAQRPPSQQNQFLRVFREARARGYLEPVPAEWIKPYEVLRINYAKLRLRVPGR